jgi:hypothetical protein
MSTTTSLDGFDELTDYGVLGRPELADVLDSQEVKVLEERFLSKGTVVVTKDGSILQAVQIRGSSRAREVWFAPSPSSRCRRGGYFVVESVTESITSTQVRPGGQVDM